MYDTHLVGTTLRDDRGERLGTVRDVIFDERTNNPAWLVVDPGALRPKHYVPAAVRRTTDGEITVPFTADDVRASPKAPKHHVLTREDADRLRSHYHLDRLEYEDSPGTALLTNDDIPEPNEPG